MQIQAWPIAFLIEFQVFVPGPRSSPNCVHDRVPGFRASFVKGCQLTPVIFEYNLPWRDTPASPFVGHVRTRVYDRDPQPAREPLWLGPHVCIWRDRTSSASASLLTYTKPLLFDQIFTDGYIGFHAWSHRHRSRSPAYEAGWWNSLFSFSLAFALFFAYMGIDKRQTNALPHARLVGRFPPSCSPGPLL